MSARAHDSPRLLARMTRSQLEWIGTVRAHNAEQRYLTAHEKDEQRYRRPQHLFAKLYLSLRLLHLRHNAAEGLDEFEEFNCT